MVLTPNTTKLLKLHECESESDNIEIYDPLAEPLSPSR